MTYTIAGLAHKLDSSLFEILQVAMTNTSVIKYTVVGDGFVG